MPPFDDLDLSTFWSPSDHARRAYTDKPCTPEFVEAVEDDLGYKLPAAYVALAGLHNGGMPRKTVHRTAAPTTWAADHVAVHGIFSIGSRMPYGLSGDRGSHFWQDTWGYPDIGVYFADCPSAGHDMFCLDYRACGAQGEPTVVHVDQERDFAITFVAPDFESFIRGLQDAEDLR